MSKIKLQINLDVPGHKAGTSVTVAADKHGTPLDKFWRDRILDAETDNCVELVKSDQKPKPKPEQKSQKESPKENS